MREEKRFGDKMTGRKLFETTSTKRIGLKQELEILQEEVRKTDNKRASENGYFGGCGIVYVLAPDHIGKALDLERDYVKGNKKSYILGSVSANGSLDIAETRVMELLNEFKKRFVGEFCSECSMHTVLL